MTQLFLNQSYNMGGTCGDCHGNPIPLTQSQLTGVRLNGMAISQKGCGRLYSPFGDCYSKGFRYPNNGEYAPINDTSPGSCGVCTADVGCSCDASCAGSSKYFGGTKCAIRRHAFLGNNAGCCLLGGGGNTTGAKENGTDVIDWTHIFDDTYTCNVDIDPYSNQGGVDCPQTVAKVCSNYDDYQNVFKQWEPNGLCYKWVVNSGNNMAAVTPVMTAAIDGVTKMWGLDLPEDSYKSQQKHISNLLNVCKLGGYGQACTDALNRMCLKRNNSNPNRFTRQDISNAFANVGDLNSQNIVSACGCHLNEEEYREYVRDGIDEGNTNACDPLCKLPGTVPKYTCEGEGNSQTCTRANCSQNICVIDDVTIDIINSNVGDISFNLACGGCQDGNCLCIFSDVNILNQASNVGDIRFSTGCGGNCVTVDPTTGIPDKKVPCPGSSAPPSSNSTWWDWISKNKWLLLVGLMGLIVCAVVVWYLKNNVTSSVPVSYSTPNPSPVDAYYPGGLKAYYGQ